MSEHLRFLVTVDSTSGAPIKVEQVGQAGDLSEVDLVSFVRSLGAGFGGDTGAPPQVVVNIYTSGSGPGASVVTKAPERLFGWDPGPPPVTPPPGKPGGRKK